jgi:GcrA cell cycle regulator
MKPPHIKYRSIGDQMRTLIHLSNQEIAERLSCHPDTVQDNRRRLGKNSPRRGWNDERVETLKKLVADGCSASQCAGQLGSVTRNAVISKVHRLGLQLRGNGGLRTSTTARKVKASLLRKPKGKGKSFVFSERMAQVQELHRDGLPIPPPAETDIPRIATVDLEAHHCRFPCVADVKMVGPYAPIYCGLKPHKGLPYCEIHSRRAFQPPQPRPRPPSSPMLAPVVENELEAA